MLVLLRLLLLFNSNDNKRLFLLNASYLLDVHAWSPKIKWTRKAFIRSFTVVFCQHLTTPNELELRKTDSYTHSMTLIMKVPRINFRTNGLVVTFLQAQCKQWKNVSSSSDFTWANTIYPVIFNPFSPKSNQH